MDTSMSDKDFIKEQSAQRQHEKSLAEVDARKVVDLERVKQDGKSERSPYKLGAAGALAVLLAIFGIIYGININDKADNETARACVSVSGAQWIDGQCFKNSEDLKTYMKEHY